MAVSIPIFTSQLKKSRLATNQANARAAKAAAVTEYLSLPDTSRFQGGNYDATTGVFTAGAPTPTSIDKINEPTLWTVDSDANLTTETFKKIGVAVGSDGQVTHYYFGN